EGEAGEGPEDRSPRDEGEDLTANGRSEDRREPRDQHEKREEARRLALVEAVAHHRAGDHHARAAPEGLGEPPGHERLDGARGGAAGRGEYVEREAEAEGAPAAEAIGDRTIESLPDAESHEEHGEGELD